MEMDVRPWVEHLAPVSHKLADSLGLVDYRVLKEQKELLNQKEALEAKQLAPFSPTPPKNKNELVQLGKKLLSQKKAACLVAAGGQGTRLGFHGPKGLYPISLVRHKTLFQIIAEKVKAASEYYGCPLPLAIMTSPENDQATKDYFRANKNFMLEEGQLSFFSQTVLPLLDEEGKLFLQSEDQLCSGPDGNGSCIRQLVKEKIFAAWQDQGIKWLFFIPIDNPLADPFDPLLLGFAEESNLEIAVKCVEKKDPEEKVGVLAQDLKTKALAVIEYSELGESQRSAREKDGSLSFKAANLSQLLFSFQFIEDNWQVELPLHLAKKAMAKFDQSSGVTLAATSPNSWKFETFIFDFFPLAKRIDALFYSREEIFAPLKNSTGSDSPATVKQLLLAHDRKRLKDLNLSYKEDLPLELSMRAHLFPPKAGSIEKLSGYIE